MLRSIEYYSFSYFRYFLAFLRLFSILFRMISELFYSSSLLNSFFSYNSPLCRFFSTVITVPDWHIIPMRREREIVIIRVKKKLTMIEVYPSQTLFDKRISNLTLLIKKIMNDRHILRLSEVLYHRWNRYRRPAVPTRSGPVRSGTGLDFGPAGLPFDRSFAVRPAVYRSTGLTGRPVDCRSKSHLSFDRLVITEKCVK